GEGRRETRRLIRARAVRPAGPGTSPSSRAVGARRAAASVRRARLLPLLGGERAYLERVNLAGDHVADGIVDRAMAVDASHAGEAAGHDDDRVVAGAAACAGVSAVLRAVVLHLDDVRA